MKIKFPLLLLTIIILTACSSDTAKIKNPRKGMLQATMQLKQVDTKKILLDSDTAPKPQYMQVYIDSTGIRNLTFLNTYNNSIYFYDYTTHKFIKKITFERKGPNGILGPMAYHIKNKDSIYVFNNALFELMIANHKGEILNKTSMIEGMDVRKSPWFLSYPQFNTETVTPFIKLPGELLLAGQFMNAIPDTLIDKFKFTARINLKTNKIRYSHSYPKQLYGKNYNWNDEIFMRAFPQLHPGGNKLIYSFPVSHDLYVTDLDSNNYSTTYGGSNFASTIYSMKKNRMKTSREELNHHIMKGGLYGALLYDKHRKLYYRFLLKGMQNATVHTFWREKPIAVIIMDKDFTYLGETVLGTWGEWHWQNSFVTKEGLNIEYLDNDDIDEVALTLKIFVPEEIKNNIQ